MNTLMAVTHQTFEDIRHTDEKGNEYWRARQLAPVLEYADFRNFLSAVDKAKLACTQSGYVIADHFGDVTEMVELGSGSYRNVKDYKLTRYACYLIVQNGDPRKPVIANGQTYFALQTRRQELADEALLDDLREDQLRILLRQQLRKHNTDLAEAAREAGVITPQEFAIFQNHGYQGLYGGLGAKDIHGKKGLKKSENILDHMGSTELAANLFRATQAEDKLRREQVKGRTQANQTHYDVGKKVRQTIAEIGGTMPEKLPTPTTSAKKLEKSNSSKTISSS